MGGGGGGRARMRAATVYTTRMESNRDQFATAISPKRGPLETWRTHPRPRSVCRARMCTYHVRYAYYTHHFLDGQDAFAGLESIEDRFGRTHSVAGMPAGTLPEKKNGGDTAFVHRGIRAYSGCHSTG